MKKIVIVLTIVFGLFYWFQIRPSNIRKKCFRMAIEHTKNFETANKGYGSCLTKYGIKPEKLFIK